MVDLPDLMNPLRVSFKRFLQNESVGNANKVASVIWTWSEESYAKIVHESALHGYPAGCSAGCYFCCHQNVQINIFEAISLADWIRSNLDETKQQIILNKAKSITAEIKSDKLDSQRWKKRLKCACLDESSGECLVYIARPMECRIGISASAKDCGDRYCDEESNSVTVQPPFAMSVRLPPVEFTYSNLPDYVAGCLIFTTQSYWLDKFATSKELKMKILSPSVIEKSGMPINMELSKTLSFIFDGSVDENLKALVRVKDFALDACEKHTHPDI